MRTTLNIFPNSLAVLLFSFLSLTGEYALAQSETNPSSGIDVLYFVLGGAILVVLIATIIVIQKMAKISGEYGLPLYDFEFPIFKRMAKSSGIVATIMILLVLWGIYLVVTYKVK